MSLSHRCRTALLAQEGFTMLIAIGVMLIAGLLVVAAFTASSGGIQLSHRDTVQKQAYYAALAGIQEYQYQLEKEPNYWQKCEQPKSGVAEASYELYEVKPLGANGHTACETSKPFETMIETSGGAADTFRVEAVGCAGKSGLTVCPSKSTSTVVVRRLVADFKASGFLQFVYYTNYEDEDPSLYEPKADCEHYAEWEEHGEKKQRSSECVLIEFVSGDSVKGPMHTNDRTALCGNPEFGRPGRTVPDKVELYLGVSACGGSHPVYNTATKSYTQGKILVPPASDESLLSYVEPAYKFSGVTQLTLNGTTNKITVVNDGKEEPVEWPENGLIYVANKGGCGYPFTDHGADGPTEKAEESNCGNVYVHGTYSKSLTVAAENDLIVNGNTYPTSVEGKLGEEPTGTASLGLIATQFVRVYHPVTETYEATETTEYSCSKGGSYNTSTKVCEYLATKSGSSYTCPKGGSYKSSTKECEYTATESVKASCPNGGSYNGATKLCEFENNKNNCNAPNLDAQEDAEAGGYGWGIQENIWIYAAILSTKHSFTVDNYNCGKSLGKLNVYGAIAQNFRGIVATSGGTGYLKNYNYDQRLASDEPPYFLQPLNTGWEIGRETATESG